MSLIIAVGSTNPVKVAAVRRAVCTVWPDARLVPVAVDSSVSAMPTSNAEGQRGALERARRAREIAGADMGIGLEGAVSESPHGMYIANWVAIIDREGRTSLANGGHLPLPECIAQEVRAGAELGPLIDRYSGQTNSKQHDGAAGYLTSGLVPRAMAFQVAVAFALAPFLHPELYAQGQNDRH
jgi:inosine/xanthosine triphosphatase